VCHAVRPACERCVLVDICRYEGKTSPADAQHDEQTAT